MMDGKDRFPVARAQYANHIFRTRRLMCLFFPAMDILRNIGKDARISAGGNLEATSKLRSKTITAMGGIYAQRCPKKERESLCAGPPEDKDTLCRVCSAPAETYGRGDCLPFGCVWSGEPVVSAGVTIWGTRKQCRGRLSGRGHVEELPRGHHKSPRHGPSRLNQFLRMGREEKAGQC